MKTKLTKQILIALYPSKEGSLEIHSQIDRTTALFACVIADTNASIFRGRRAKLYRYNSKPNDIMVKTAVQQCQKSIRELEGVVTAALESRSDHAATCQCIELGSAVDTAMSGLYEWRYAFPELITAVVDIAAAVLFDSYHIEHLDAKRYLVTIALALLCGCQATVAQLLWERGGSETSLPSRVRWYASLLPDLISEVEDNIYVR